MKKRIACPDCHTPMTVGPTADRTDACPQCGYRPRRPKEPSPARGEERPGRPGGRGTKRREKEKHRKKAAPSAAAVRWWVAIAGGGGLLVAGIVTIVALVVMFSGGGEGGNLTQQIEDDRQAIRQAAPVNEFPPVAWTLRPEPGPKLVFPDRLTVKYEMGFAHAVSLPGRGPEYLSSEGNPGVEQLCFGRFDLTTGKPVGPARKLKHVDGGRTGAILLGGTSIKVTPTAVSPAGALAIDSVRNGPWSLPIYLPDQDTPRTIPGLKAASWFDFSADEKLWVLTGGTLAAWDVAAGKSASTAKGTYTVPALMGPDRKWLVAQVDDNYLEVLDAATGECRGRIGGEGRWQSLAVSPDGKRLVAARFAGSGFSAYAGGYDFPLDVHEWDLTTGERTAIVTTVRKSNEANSLHWITADHVLVEEAVVDMKLKMHTAGLRAKSDPGSKAPGTLRDAGWSPDGKRWVAAASSGLVNQLVPLAIPLETVKGEPGFHPGDAVRVEARCGQSALDARVTAAMSDVLKYYGFRVADGGWTLRVTATASETGKKLTYGSSSEVAVPEVKGTVELVAPDGSVVATSPHTGMTPLGPGSKFYKGSDKPQIIGQGSVDRYDFGPRSPGEAMREEAWTHFIRTLPTSGWPRAAWKSGDKYVPLPLTIEVDPAPKVDP